jgi:hypothetical protein
VWGIERCAKLAAGGLKWSVLLDLGLMVCSEAEILVIVMQAGGHSTRDDGFFFLVVQLRITFLPCCCSDADAVSPAAAGGRVFSWLGDHSVTSFEAMGRD